MTASALGVEASQSRTTDTAPDPQRGARDQRTSTSCQGRPRRSSALLDAASHTAGPTGDRWLAAFRWGLPRPPCSTADLALELLQCDS